VLAISLSKESQLLNNSTDLKFEAKGSNLVVYAGFPSALARCLALEGDYIQDKQFISTFLNTYRLFMSGPTELFLNLKNRYEYANKMEDVSRAAFLKLRVINVFKRWIFLHPEEFREDDELSASLDKWAEELQQEGGKASGWAESLNDWRRAAIEPRTFRSLGEPVEPDYPKHLKDKIILADDMLDIPPEEIARQLTLIDWRLFSAIHYTELLKKKWSGPNKDTEAHNTVEMINRFNKVAFWVLSDILRHNDVKMRARALKYHINVMMHMRNMNNFNGVMVYYSAFNNTCLTRLQQTWKELSSKKSNALKEIGHLLSSQQNNKVYRDALLNATPPVIPIISISLSDLTFIDENADTDADGMVNWEKMCMVGKVIERIQHCQSTQYNIIPVPEILHLLTDNMFVLSEKRLYEQSKLLEPSAGAAVSATAASAAPAAPADLSNSTEMPKGAGGGLKRQTSWLGGLRRKRIISTKEGKDTKDGSVPSGSFLVLGPK